MNDEFVYVPPKTSEKFDLSLTIKFNNQVIDTTGGKWICNLRGCKMKQIKIFSSIDTNSLESLVNRAIESNNMDVDSIKFKIIVRASPAMPIFVAYIIYDKCTQ